MNLRDLHPFMNGDVRGGANSAEEIFRHAGAELFANEQMHRAVAAAFGKEHRCLPGGISRADDGDIQRVVQDRFNRCAGVMNAGRFEAFGAFGVELSPAHAGGDEHCPGRGGSRRNRV